MRRILVYRPFASGCLRVYYMPYYYHLENLVSGVVAVFRLYRFIYPPSG